MADGTLSSTAGPPPFGETSPTGRVDLRPLTTSELIDRGFALYRAHFAGFLLLALLAQTAPLLSQILITAAKFNPTANEILEKPVAACEKLGWIVVIWMILQVIAFGFQVIATFFIADAYLGKIPSVTASFRKFTARIVSSVWTCLIHRLLVGATFIFPVLAFCAAYSYELFYPPITFLPILLFWSATFLLFVASMVPVLVVFMRLWVIVPPVALENVSGWKAVRRSSALVRYDPGLGLLYWGEMRLSFLLLPLFIIGLLFLSVTALPVFIYQMSESIRHGSGNQLIMPPDSTLILSQILAYLTGSIIWPLYAIATTLFYYDVRIRSEGFDLEFLAQQLGDGK
jgi:hypothetical protein